MIDPSNSEPSPCFTCGYSEDTVRLVGCGQKPTPTHDPCLYVDLLGLEAEADDSDIADRPPTLPEIWVAELVLDGEVKGRVLLKTREEAEQALAANWRIVKYVRADRRGS